MHNVLLIPELRSYIFDYLANDAESWTRPSMTPKCNQGPLATLARTCRTFSEPALDALWCELPTLRPLLQCVRAGVSDDLFPEHEDESLLPLNDEEWKVVLRYTHRIRRLTIRSLDELSIKILQAVQFRTALLLPNLRELHWSHTNFDLIYLVLSPSLHLLDVSLGSRGKTSVLAFLECYHASCPNLKSLRFTHAFDGSSWLVAEVSRAVCRSPSLDSLACGDLSEDAFLHITKSRRLKKLSLYSLSYHPNDLKRLASYSTSDRPPFENLRSLHLGLKELSSVILYLKACCQPFEDISVSFSEISFPHVFREFFTALNTPTRRKSLRQIHLSNFHKNGTREHTAPQIDFEVLSPLLGFNLHGFYLSLQNSISLDDNGLIRLVQGWPDLETLQLNPDRGWGPTHFPTPTGLFNLLTRCPKLRFLLIYINAGTLSTEVGSRIMVVEVVEYGWPIGRPVREGVSRLVLDYFPSPDTIRPQAERAALVPDSNPDAPFRYRFRWRSDENWDISSESSGMASEED